MPMVTFSFDDVPASACEVGAPLLERYGVRGTFFIAAEGCATAGSNGSSRASFDQIKAIWRNGHEIGCHTFSHPAVSQINRTALDVELARNRAALREIDAGIVMRNFAYPYGDLSIRSKRHLERRFDSCRSIRRGINRGRIDLGALRAWPLEDSILGDARIAELIAETSRLNGWLIFFSHDVADPPSRFGVSPGLLEFAIRAALAAGCVVTTLTEALGRTGYRNAGA